LATLTHRVAVADPCHRLNPHPSRHLRVHHSRTSVSAARRRQKGIIASRLMTSHRQQWRHWWPAGKPQTCDVLDVFSDSCSGTMWLPQL